MLTRKICADAVFLTTELCCSEGVRLWYQSNQIWNVSKALVKGNEEFFSVSPKTVRTPILESTDWRAKRQKTSKLIQGKGSFGLNTVLGGSEANGTPSTILPLEYSPVRHRSAIERVLSALQGKDPILDSATKVWTTFAVAKNFQITHSPLEDYIIRWLRAYPNSYFLEVLPEVSHQIADGLQNYDLARDSFAILVGEEALDSLRHTREPRVHKHTTFGRKKEGLPEHIHTRIEYASKSFLERIYSDFADLVVNGMQWIDQLPEVRRLSAYTQPELQNTVRKLKDLLKDYVRGALYKILCMSYDTVPGPDLHNDGGGDLLPRVDRAAVWANMPLGERILSRTYWEALRSFGILQGASNLDIQKGLIWTLRDGLNQLSPIEKQELDRGTYRQIMNSELRALMRIGQTHLDQASNPSPNLRNAQQGMNADLLSARVSTLPDRTTNGTQGQNEHGDFLLAPTQNYNLYNAQRESHIEPFPNQTYTLPYRTSNGAQDIATNDKASLSRPAQPIDVPNPLKRTQHSHDALSPPDERQSDIDVRTKWPFGAARDDPIAQVQKRVAFLLPADGMPATDHASENSLGQGLSNEGIPRGINPWRGYSDQLSRANGALQYLELNGNGGVQQDLEDLEAVKNYFRTKFFDLELFFNQAQGYIDAFAMNKLRSSDHLELGIINTLVCLEDSEWKYLPLYAGGNDDGSMGVYNDDLPTADHGFTTAGPEVHDGSTPANSVEAASEFDLVSAGDSASTFNASTATNRGFSDTVRRGHVHAVDSADGSMSDSCTIVTPSVDSDEEETFARQLIEAQERIEEAEQAAANQARRIMKGKGKMVDEDESYADLFEGEEEEEEEDGNDTDRAEVNDEDEDEDDMVMV